MGTQVEMQKNLLSDCISSLKLWKDTIETYLDGSDNETELEELKEVVKDYCRIEQEGALAASACSDVCQHFNDNNSSGADIDQYYAKKLNENRGNDEEYEQHPIWNEVFTGDGDVMEVEMETQTLETQYEELNDSILYSNVFTPPLDPISKMVIKEPYKNKLCGHIYEHKYILQYVKSMQDRAKCPYMGCGNKNMSVRQLVADRVTKDKIKAYLQNQEQASHH